MMLRVLEGLALAISPIFLYTVYTKSRAASHNSAREDCEENFRQNKAENRRNTLCISRFDNAVMAEISRKTPQMQMCGVALEKMQRGTLSRNEHGRVPFLRRERL
jgi:hypothetical protein